MTICVRLTDRALVEVSGEDRLAFLQGLLSQSVEDLAPGEARYGALLTPQGRLLFDLFIIGRPDAVWLDVAADRRDELVTRLKIYKLRSRVDIRPLDAGVWTCWPDAPGPGWVADPRREGLARRAWGPESPPAETAGPVDWRRRRLEFGVGDAEDFDFDRDYPVELNFDRVGGIDFAKGCFVGQETTSRMKRRGQVKTRLVPIRFAGPPPTRGSEVLNGALRAGEVRSGVEGLALALLRLDRLDGALTADGRTVSAEPPLPG
ncbi:MAG: folate-binding protein YgfZ [Phenylobacterium sp.]|uniref:CAF17-like 4Fe-4S cluster assembly/insertion protein YgfZ n=1 Tax=Phenylobacterium sp. TaxID=1871053 RepID=UPI0025EACE7E|nr:folate-binding protein [Phenylobacterium sp.]MCA6232280.1 folate-binding protein YgfZ [Phenylobacterium sp.]MCA6250276.1 folate-binding protein YgfZ [Phenylobacterium sp.]MCA6253045.1 folate-binding protein YgfZ [Phenylobacterium sp.]MCA6258788.1 folate-binding protein YgfZ [Phenylobacterium sp.]MCA6264036.1 folate-binding protein YgfZ [Phenylobacterium sp.]